MKGRSSGVLLKASARASCLMMTVGLSAYIVITAYKGQGHSLFAVLMGLMGGLGAIGFLALWVLLVHRFNTSVWGITTDTSERIIRFVVPIAASIVAYIQSPDNKMLVGGGICLIGIHILDVLYSVTHRPDSD